MVLTQQVGPFEPTWDPAQTTRFHGRCSMIHLHYSSEKSNVSLQPLNVSAILVFLSRTQTVKLTFKFKQLAINVITLNSSSFCFNAYSFWSYHCPDALEVQAKHKNCLMIVRTLNNIYHPLVEDIHHFSISNDLGSKTMILQAYLSAF